MPSKRKKDKRKEQNKAAADVGVQEAKAGLDIAKLRAVSLEEAAAEIIAYVTTDQDKVPVTKERALRRVAKDLGIPAECLDFLAAGGTDLNEADGLADRRTALHWAIANNNDKAVARLLVLNARYEVPDVHGDTALAYAAKSKNENIKRLVFTKLANDKVDLIASRFIFFSEGEEAQEHAITRAYRDQVALPCLANLTTHKVFFSIETAFRTYGRGPQEIAPGKKRRHDAAMLGVLDRFYCSANLEVLHKTKSPEYADFIRPAVPSVMVPELLNELFKIDLIYQGRVPLNTLQILNAQGECVHEVLLLNGWSSADPVSGSTLTKADLAKLPEGVVLAVPSAEECFSGHVEVIAYLTRYFDHNFEVFLARTNSFINEDDFVYSGNETSAFLAALKQIYLKQCNADVYHDGLHTYLSEKIRNARDVRKDLNEAAVQELLQELIATLGNSERVLRAFRSACDVLGVQPSGLPLPAAASVIPAAAQVSAAKQDVLRIPQLQIYGELIDVVFSNDPVDHKKRDAVLDAHKGDEVFSRHVRHILQITSSYLATLSPLMVIENYAQRLKHLYENDSLTQAQLVILAKHNVIKSVSDMGLEEYKQTGITVYPDELTTDEPTAKLMLNLFFHKAMFEFIAHGHQLLEQKLQPSEKWCLARSMVNFLNRQLIYFSRVLKAIYSTAEEITREMESYKTHLAVFQTLCTQMETVVTEPVLEVEAVRAPAQATAFASHYGSASSALYATVASVSTTSMRQAVDDCPPPVRRTAMQGGVG